MMAQNNNNNNNPVLDVLGHRLADVDLHDEYEDDDDSDGGALIGQSDDGDSDGCAFIDPHDDDEDDDGGGGRALMDLDSTCDSSFATAVAAAPSGSKHSPLNTSFTYAVKQSRSDIGKVAIGSDTATGVGTSSGSDLTDSDRPLAFSAADWHEPPPALVPSNVPASLNITFSPILQPPTDGLIIRTLGVGPGAGFVNVVFVNCTFDRLSPTIFENCWLSNVTFSDCSFGASQFENVAISGARFNGCTFECFWKNYKLVEQLVANDLLFQGIHLNSVVPHAIAVQDRERKMAEVAKWIDGEPTGRRHETGFGVVEGSRKREDQYLRHKRINTVERSWEASSIPLSVKGLSFDNTPQAGLFVKNSSGGRYEGVQFINCRFKNTTFDNCYLVDVVFEGCNFENASFVEVVLKDRIYNNVGFEGCNWKWQVLSIPVTVSNRTYRQRLEIGSRIPQAIVNHIAVQARDETRHAQLRQAVLDASRPLAPPPHHHHHQQQIIAPLVVDRRHEVSLQAAAHKARVAQKLLRRNLHIQTADEVLRERLAPGECLVTEMTPGAFVQNEKEDSRATKFVQIDFSGW